MTQEPEVTPSHGALSGFFGYVTPEDQARWAQARAANKQHVSALKQGLQAGVNALLEFSTLTIQSKLSAVHRVAEQQRFDETHERIVRTRRGPQRSIIESVNYEPKDEREEIDLDYGGS